MFATKVSTIKWINTNRGVAQVIAMRKCTANGQPQQQQQQQSPRSNNREHLYRVHQQLADSLPYFFIAPHCFKIYSQSVVFEDNIRHLKTVGLGNYVKQLNYVKFWAHFKYSHKEMNVLKITEHPEDMTVRVRWRIVGTPGLSSLLIFTFWRYKPFNKKDNLTKEKTEWTDGFSVFHVNSDGLVDKHIVEKIIPDDDRLQTDSKSSIGNVKLALMVGLLPGFSSESIDLFHKSLQKVLELSLKFGSFG